MANPTQTVVITGGNTGLGLECARVLAADPSWHVVLACRSLERAGEAIAQLQAEASGGLCLTALPLDLASLASVRAFPQALTDAQLPPLKALVCNAGMQVVSGTQRTVDGFELTFAVNHLGHFLLANLLVPALQAPARVVFVASGTHDPAQRTGMPAPGPVDARTLANPPADDPGGNPMQVGFKRYTTSKLANVMCAYEMARRVHGGEDPVDVFAFDPGLMPGTGLARDNGPLQRFAWRYLLPPLRFLLPFMHTPGESGRALARLVTDPALAGTGGRYFEGMKAVRSSEASYDTDMAHALWTDSAALVGLDLGAK